VIKKNNSNLKNKRKQFIFQFTILLIFLIYPFSISAQIVYVGSGSYSTVLPSGALGPQYASGANAIPKISDNFDQPIQTNDFWSSIIYPFQGSSYSNITYAHPLAYKAVNNGLEMGYTSDYIFAADDYLYPYSSHLTVSISGLSSSETVTDRYDDWTVTALWEGTSVSMEATFGHGLPYTFFRVTDGTADAIITPNETPTVWYNQDEVLGITIAGKHYGIFAPNGSTWLGNGPFQSSLNGEDYFSVAILPDNNTQTLELFRNHAYAFVTNSYIDWEYDDDTAVLSSTYTYETELLNNSNPAFVNETLTALYRHQWLNTTNSLTDYTYESPRGVMKLLEGNTFTTDLTFSGILPSLPNRGDYDIAELTGYVQEVANESLPSGPTYENGKAMARFCNLVHIADQLGLITERDHFLDEMKNRLEDWFTVGGGQEYSFIENWNVLTGYPSGYGADTQINDHHFHSGYAIITAATVALYDPDWATLENWGGMVNMLIKDSNNWDRTENQFPFLRSHDIYAGHSWAAGHADFAEGNNQESSSESMNFASAVFLWGEATDQQEIRDLGIFLHTTETSAIEQYWFDVENIVFPADYSHVALGMVWGGKGVHGTWFGADPEFIHGINMLPITSGSLYLGRNPDYVISNYNEVVEERGGQPIIWQDIHWQYLALSDPELALSYYNANSSYTPFDGESRAHTHHWIYNLLEMGHLDLSITADIPTYSVFKDDNYDLTYVAYNAGTEDKVVTFSDGYSMTVGPKQMNSFSTANPNAPVVQLSSNINSGVAPLSVEFTGGNSYDPNGSSLTYLWDFDDNSTSQANNVTHVFNEEGIYNVTLTVTNELNLSSTGDITITVLESGIPYLGTPFSIPGLIEAEYFDLGGEGIGYHDSDSQNLGGVFRTSEGVDIEVTTDTGAGYNVGWVEDGEWLNYSVEVENTGIYSLTPRISSEVGGGSVNIELNGVDLTGNITIPSTGGWQVWEDLVIPDIFMEAGTQIMRVNFHGGQFNLNSINVVTITEINNSHIIPKNFELGQNYPNPFNPNTKIDLTLPQNEFVSVTIYNSLGQEIFTVVNQFLEKGKHSFTWNADEFDSGVYYYQMKANNFTSLKKMIVLK